ncbi:predicted protein [Nematostella vectensis]|uniref:Ribonuclease P protein subunit p29 n=2 Tax=Nematostella vectensis TaxID=45351 RepID=A7SHU0_NEMVE|nr:predicted protein [Nematostella vectensis]|eukprot:XP_001628774.1 predicted protein [Nematostella vectensis]
MSQTVQKNINSNTEETLHRQPLMLDRYQTRRNKKVKKSKCMSAREKREKKVYDIEPEHQRYELFLPLHKLWREYMQDMLKLQLNSNLKGIYPRLLKADYHGCLVAVCRSKCPSYVGTTGIIIQETRNVFKIITRDDSLKMIPKANSVFSFQLEDFMFKIYGNHFRFRASERSVRKFKTKATVDL